MSSLTTEVIRFIYNRKEILLALSSQSDIRWTALREPRYKSVHADIRIFIQTHENEYY